jgi:hypothetical protein
MFLEAQGASDFRPQYWPRAVIGVISMLIAGRLFRGRMVQAAAVKGR